MTAGKIIVHSDVIIDFLLHNGPSTHPLRQIMRKWFCYTTVFNAIELFSLAANQAEHQAVRDSLSSMKILGLNSKNALTYSKLYRKHGGSIPRMNLFVAGLSLETKLPILTSDPAGFSGIRDLRLVSPLDLCS